MCFYENLNATESFGINYELIPEAGGVNVGRKTVDLEVIKFGLPLNFLIFFRFLARLAMKFTAIVTVVMVRRAQYGIILYIPTGTIYYTAVTPGKHNYCFTSKTAIKVTFQILGGHPADSGVPAHLRCKKHLTFLYS